MWLIKIWFVFFLDGWEYIKGLQIWIHFFPIYLKICNSASFPRDLSTTYLTSFYADNLVWSSNSEKEMLELYHLPHPLIYSQSPVEYTQVHKRTHTQLFPYDPLPPRQKRLPQYVFAQRPFDITIYPKDSSSILLNTKPITILQHFLTHALT